MSHRLISPSKVTSWLECEHYLTLDSQLQAGMLALPYSVTGSYAELLRDKGTEHEKACFAAFDAERRIRPIPAQKQDETFDAFVARAGNPFLEEDWDVLYQMPFIHEGMRGTADFIIRIHDENTGAVRFEPIDAKLSRNDAKPGHVLQLCFYADGIEALTGVTPERIHIHLGSGRSESLLLNDFRPYWRRLRSELVSALEAGPWADTEPQPCSHCQFCEFKSVCDKRWQDERSTILVARIRTRERSELAAAGITTLDQLAAGPPAIDGIKDDRLAWLHDQASLQHIAEQQDPMPYKVLGRFHDAGDPEDDDYKHRLPLPDDGDVFIDFEGHPFWTIEQGLFFLFGLLARSDGGDWTFIPRWAHDKGEEYAAAAELINYLAERRKQYPHMHIYHYNSTERTVLEGLADGHPTAEKQIKDLVETGAFIDLYRTVLNSIQIGAESYSLKRVEKLTDFERRHAIESGAGAVLSYENYMKHGKAADLNEIAGYNEDDVRATLAVRDWLVGKREPETIWRAAVLESDAEPTITELREREIGLHAFGPGSYQHFLGDLIGYWWRERQADLGPKRAKLEQRDQELLNDPAVIAGLTFVDRVERSDKRTGKAILPGEQFAFPEQDLGSWATAGANILFIDGGANTRHTTIAAIDRDTCHVQFVWSDRLQEAGSHPTAVVHDDWVPDKTKALALQAFADDMLDDRQLNPVTLGVLTRAAPRFIGEGPTGGEFSENLNDLEDLVNRLDHSCLSIQGPPGTGKTFTGARLIRSLLLANKRIGVTAFSHAAINNLLREVYAVFRREGGIEHLRCARQKSGAENLPTEIVLADNTKLAGATFNLIAGSTWAFSSRALRDNPVDVLFIDEAGQLGLADALAASTAADNVVLLGDPLQLAHVTKAHHPAGSGLSVLDHMLDGESIIRPDRGVFLSVSRRMHPDVCRFISQQIYKGLLESHEDCRIQSTAAGTGLRWLPVQHSGNTTASPEEAGIILRTIKELIGSAWTDGKGRKAPLTADDFVVVTPYNDQRMLLEELFSCDEAVRNVEIATVDKFQGQEKTVVFFSMVASTTAEAPRGLDFLFSRHRLNVAISRARCLAYLVCTEELLKSRARNVDDMRLISTLNAFVEFAKSGPKSVTMSDSQTQIAD